MLYKLTLYVTHIVMHKRIRQIVISLLVRTVTRACVNAVTKYRLTMYIYIIRCLSAVRNSLSFAYDTCLHTCLLLNKSVLAIIIIAYLITR